MEAAGVGCAAGSDMAPLIAETNGSVKKIFRARKTMTASCRQQIAAINKIKLSSKMESQVKESLTVLPAEMVQQPELMCKANYIAQDNSSSKINKSQGIFHNGLKVSIEVSQVDSEFNIGCSYNETWKDITKQAEDISSVLLTPVHFSHSKHLQVNDTSNATAEPQRDDVSQIASPPNPGKQTLRERGLQTPESSTVQSFKKDSEQTVIDECCSVSENLNASITLKIVAEDNSLEKTSSIGLVPPVVVLDRAGSNMVIPSKELNDSFSTVDTSTAPAFTVSLTADSDTGNLPQNYNSADSGCQRKRPFSESSDVPESKRAKISNKIQCLIDCRVQNFFKEGFDQRMQDLAQQVNLIKCNGSHADKFARHLKNIKRLEKRIKHAVQVQSKVDNGSSELPTVSSGCDELPKTETTLSASNIAPTAESEISLSRMHSTQSLNTDRTELVVLSDNESEQQRKSEQIKTDRPNYSPKKVDNAVRTPGAVQSSVVAVSDGLRLQAMRKIMESIKEHRAHSSKTDKQTKTVIDLTDDEEQISDKDSKLDEKFSPPRENISAPLVPTPEHVTVEKLPDKAVEKKELIPLNNTDEASIQYDMEERKQSVHKSSKSKNPHDSVALLKTPLKPDLGMLKLPQKPELRLAQVQNPKGIALSWNVKSVDPSCSPAIAYCLYVHQEDPNRKKKLWKKIGEIKALPLPMACTLTQFVDDTTYYFAMRAKDACGRFGPLCDIQSTTVKQLNSSKKI
ncbi:activating transcription factor 7-interacting protein 2 isoform X2 [Mixophyes fleayi]|uniref:activating transcription factor 7-interacting protein 2 isoform X2 n=1 Tax=Mixophyes fleayi TaxID=3061075 RepID=UPI003F4DF461